MTEHAAPTGFGLREPRDQEQIHTGLRGANDDFLPAEMNGKCRQERRIALRQSEGDGRYQFAGDGIDSHRRGHRRRAAIEDGSAIGRSGATGVVGRLDGIVINELHDEIIGINVEKRRDVGMIQLGNGAGFLLKAVRGGGLEELDSDGAVEAGIASFPHFTHAAPADG